MEPRKNSITDEPMTAELRMNANAYHETYGAAWHILVTTDGTAYQWQAWNPSRRISGNVPYSEGYTAALEKARHAADRLH